MKLSRRTVLKGAGTAMALPLFEAMMPLKALAGTRASPLRMAFLSFPNGVDTTHWFPSAVGAEFEFSATLAPLKGFQKDLLVLSGLAHTKANANGDGPGDHARSAATFLTGRQARKTPGKDIEVGVSVDQIAAQKIGAKTFLPSLEIGCDRSAQSGNCDSGYSCAYSSNISWRGPSSPTSKEISPRALFERLFGDLDQIAAQRDRARQQMLRRSILDLVQGDADALSKKLGGGDRRKLDEYLESVRSIEQRLQAAEKDFSDRPRPAIDLPRGIPRDNEEHIRLMTDLLVLAFQTDSTRIATFMLANEGSDRPFPSIGVKEGHHTLSHHGRRKSNLEKIQKIDEFYVRRLAYLLEKLKASREGDETLLDRSMILYGSGIGDGDAHNHDELPVLLAGRGGGTLSPGRHVRFKRGTPMCNLFLSMLDRLGVEEKQFGDSTGRLPDLTI